MTTGPVPVTAAVPQKGDDTESQQRAHDIVFIVSICCLLIEGAGYILLFLRRPGSPKLVGQPNLKLQA